MPTSHAWGACCPDRSPAAARPARPLAVRAASFARRVGSKPGQAPQASRRPPIGRGPVCCPARHRRRPRAPQTTGAAAGFSGPPMWSGLSCWDFGALGCVLLQTSSIGGVFRVDYWTVVTNVVNPTAFSLKIKVFGRRLTTFVTEVLARRFKLLRFNDVCNTAAHRSLSQAGVPPPHS